MKLFIALFIATVAICAADVSFEDEAISPAEEAPVMNLMAAVKHLRDNSPSHMSFHVQRVAKHASLLQSFDETDKAKAYAHNFAASKAAIKAALNGLNSQLSAGHAHDQKALSQGLNAGNSAISNAYATGKSTTAGYKNKACPTKRKETEADAAKGAAKRAMQAIQNTKMCSSGVSQTWKDMDVDKSTPKFGNDLRNKWFKARSNWVNAKNKYDAAVKAHKAAQTTHNLAMASFHTACKLQAENAHSACKNAHTEYNVLKKEVAGNVAMRKQVWIAVGVVECYVSHLTDNTGAKKCADGARGKDTSRWNITPANLPACHSTATLRNTFGPLSWAPTSGNCGGHWKKTEDLLAAHTFKGLNCPTGYVQKEGRYCTNRYGGPAHKPSSSAASSPNTMEKLTAKCDADPACKAFDVAFADNKYGHLCNGNGGGYSLHSYKVYKTCVHKARMSEDISMVEAFEQDMTETSDVTQAHRFGGSRL